MSMVPLADLFNHKVEGGEAAGWVGEAAAALLRADVVEPFTRN